jgi:uncharacterized membrane protein
MMTQLQTSMQTHKMLLLLLLLLLLLAVMLLHSSCIRSRGQCTSAAVEVTIHCTGSDDFMLVCDHTKLLLVCL